MLKTNAKTGRARQVKRMIQVNYAEVEKSEEEGGREIDFFVLLLPKITEIWGTLWRSYTLFLPLK